MFKVVPSKFDRDDFGNIFGSYMYYDYKKDLDRFRSRYAEEIIEKDSSGQEIIIRKHKFVDNVVVEMLKELENAPDEVNEKGQIIVKNRNIKYDGYVYEMFRNEVIMVYRDYSNDLKEAYEEALKKATETFSVQFSSVFKFLNTLEGFSSQMIGKFEMRYDVHEDHVSIRLTYTSYPSCTHLSEVCRIYEVLEIE